MMGRPIDELVYHQLFPRPKVSDPSNFQAFLQRLLLPEVREETHSFYGHIKTPEARYPGLDYAHHTHRLRLSRWPWHRRLFRAFDALALTRAEIAALTRWEGTRWAKEKYEREQGVAIRDTAGDICPTWENVMRTHRVSAAAATAATAITTATVRGTSVSSSSAESASADSPSASLSSSPVTGGISTPPYQPADDNVVDDEDEDDSSSSSNNNNNSNNNNRDQDDECDDEISSSVGVELNARLRAQAARRDAGDSSAVLDEAWEEWFKTALESGELAVVTEDMVASTTSTLHRQRRSAARARSNSRLSSLPSAIVPAALIPSSIMDLARAGQWSEIPQPLHQILRQVVGREATASAPSTLTTSSSTLTASSSSDAAAASTSASAAPIVSSSGSGSGSDSDLAATPRAFRQQISAVTPRSAMGFNFFGPPHMVNPSTTATDTPVTRTADTYTA